MKIKTATFTALAAPLAIAVAMELGSIGTVFAQTASPTMTSPSSSYYGNTGTSASVTPSVSATPSTSYPSGASTYPSSSSSTSGASSTTGTSGTTGSGTGGTQATPGTPNTGAGGDLATNMAILLASGIVGIGSGAYLVRRMSAAR